ncbi:unnamed protein product [Sphenostylis stenocarpa]|uniref:Uncharacterized protein n=1 Tax=Sphenostylis stenocarpa TaxID=92480 RepID=A0AA86VWD5_9FABA|nr:unnamed protein product [Sphenostylis stenocarpa]
MAVIITKPRYGLMMWPSARTRACALSPAVVGHGGRGVGAWGDGGWPHLEGGRNNDAVSEKQSDFKSLGGETNDCLSSVAE